MITCNRILNKGICKGEMKVVSTLEGGKVYKCKKCGNKIATNVDLEKLREKDKNVN